MDYPINLLIDPLISWGACERPPFCGLQSGLLFHMLIS